MKLNSASAVQFSFCNKVNSMGFFGGVKASEVMPDARNADLRFPFSVMLGCAKKAAGVITSGSMLILRVFRWGNESKITNSVISSNAVDMINLHIGPFVVNKKPSKSVGGMELPAKHYLDVTLSVNSSSSASRFSQSGAVFLPRENTSVYIVIKGILQKFFGNNPVIDSHIFPFGSPKLYIDTARSAT